MINITILNVQEDSRNKKIKEYLISQITLSHFQLNKILSHYPKFMIHKLILVKLKENCKIHMIKYV